MTHEDDVARALCRAYATALAIRVVEFESVTHAFQYAFRAIGAAVVALIADTTGQAAGRFSGIFEAQVDFVERRASLCHIE